MKHYLSFYGKKWLINISITLLMVTLGVLSYNNNLIYDWTTQKKNSLSPSSIAMLELVKTPVKITSYTIKSDLQSQIKKLIRPYQYHNPLIQLKFVDPSLDPNKIRALGIQVEGELVIKYMNKTEHLIEISEQKLSNTLIKLSKQSQRKIYFISGHGERRYNNKANFDLSSLSVILKNQGFQLQQSDIMALEKQVTKQDILVLAGPQSQIFEGEVEMLIDLLERGINFLWLADPHLADPHLNKSSKDLLTNSLYALSEYLGFEFSEGIIVDPATQQLKLSRPDFAVISEYLKQHPISSALTQTSIFPQALAIDPLANNDEFVLKPFLLTSGQSWLETSALQKTINYDKGLDIAGPLILAISLEREIEKDDDSLHYQRIVVIGDGDFISNRYLANGGNTALGLNIFNWLSAQEELLAIEPKFYINQKINLSKNQLVVLGIFFFIVLPVLLLLIGLLIAYKRKNDALP